MIHSIRFSPLSALVMFTIVLLVIFLVSLFALKASFLPLRQQRRDTIKSIERAPPRSP